MKRLAYIVLTLAGFVLAWGVFYGVNMVLGWFFER